MKENYLIRVEEIQDYKQVETLTREAFWDVHVPGCDEHYLVHILRDSPAFIAELDFVLVIDNEIIGNIMYTDAEIINESGKVYKIITFGPVSILPKYQALGYGSLLIKHSLKKASELGYKLVAIYGDPAFYSRLGFTPGEKYDIYSSDGYYNPALQVLELIPDTLDGISGSFKEDRVFSLDQEKATEFEAQFPLKEKGERPSQQVFLNLISQRKKRV